ncbi:hypothetical protein PPYR_03656 [Photinus pyralis]|uniref:ODAD1 central coiled coil region domain-containing protein n=1 Tax=Photinus pyralis TaxID=7054 RepID=A0A5N4A3G8_PHOPY|nr:uncharacterized protein LOC116161329 [Photinus pyralis]KAB0791856.1 hypothetical protein PPYR_03656 [Photinus pyralis]
MASKVKTVSPEKKFEMDLQAEDALKRSMVQFRNLVSERGALTSDAELARCMKVSQILTREHVDVLLDVLVACSAGKLEQDERMRSELAALVVEREEFSRRIIERKHHLRELDSDITAKRKLIDEISTRVPSDLQILERQLLGQKTLEGLENKLDTYMKQFGLMSADSCRLRLEIEHQLIERESFNKLWYTYIANLNKGKRIMMDIVEQATLAYDRRDEWIARLQSCRDFAYNDYIRATQEMDHLQKKLDKDRDLIEFVGVREQYRNMKQLLELKRKRRMEKREEMEEDLRRYGAILNEIQSFSHIEPKKNTGKFIANYGAVETVNLASFVYVEQLQSDIENVTEEIMGLQGDIVRQRNLQAARAVQQKTKIEDLKKQFRAAKKEADSAESASKSMRNNFQKIYNGIDKLFKICKCNVAPLIDLLGENTKINDFNVLLYLQILESDVVDLLANAYYKQKTAAKAKGKAAPSVIREEALVAPMYQVKSLVPTNPCPLCVDLEMVSDVIDTLQQVQSKEEVDLKLKLRLKLPDGLNRLHNVSACHLPKSRQIIQRRYQ